MPRHNSARDFQPVYGELLNKPKITGFSGFQSSDSKANQALKYLILASAESRGHHYTPIDHRLLDRLDSESVDTDDFQT